ncbi:MAG: M50 family metallopeptidase [Deltaproteobacteria bacterium]|nr:M50 family metallopeptidase [Deltaproteobacteria bacterium]
MNRRDSVELRTLAVALLVSLLLWNLPFGGLLLYPFKLLATWLHELSHGIAMTVTGAGFDYVLIYRDTSGLAYAKSSVGPFGTAIIAAAGYMGTPLWGAVLLVATPTERAARRALLVLAGLLVVSSFTVIAARPDDSFGPWAIASIGAGVGASALLLPTRWRLAVAHFLAAQSCVNALLDIRVLLRPSQVVGGQFAGMSDAGNMALATFGTTDEWAVWTWAGIWLAWSLAVLYIALRLSGSPGLSSAARSARPTASPRDESDRGERRRSPETARDETGPSARADTGEP